MSSDTISFRGYSRNHWLSWAQNNCLTGDVVVAAEGAVRRWCESNTARPTADDPVNQGNPIAFYPDDPRYYILLSKNHVDMIALRSEQLKGADTRNWHFAQAVSLNNVPLVLSDKEIIAIWRQYAFDKQGKIRYISAKIVNILGNRGSTETYFISLMRSVGASSITKADVEARSALSVVEASGQVEDEVEIELDEYAEPIFPEDVNYDELLEDWSSYGEILENAKMLTASGTASQIAGGVTAIAGLATTGAVAAGFAAAGVGAVVLGGAAILSQEILKRRHKRFFALHTALSGNLAFAYINETGKYVSPEGVFRKLKKQGKKTWENIDREGLDYSMWVERNIGIESALVGFYWKAMYKDPANNPQQILEGLYELAKELYSQPPPAVLAYDATLLEWQQGKIDDTVFYKIVGAVSHHPNYSTNWAAIPSAKAVEAWKKITGGDLPKFEGIYFPEEGQHAPYAGGFYRGGDKDVPRGKYPTDYWREINSQLTSTRPGKEETSDATEGGLSLTGAETGIVAVSELKNIVEGAKLGKMGAGTTTVPESSQDKALSALESWVGPVSAGAGWSFGEYSPTVTGGEKVDSQGWDGGATPVPRMPPVGLASFGTSGGGATLIPSFGPPSFAESSGGSAPSLPGASNPRGGMDGGLAGGGLGGGFNLGAGLGAGASATPSFAVSARIPSTDRFIPAPIGGPQADYPNIGLGTTPLNQMNAPQQSQQPAIQPQQVVRMIVNRHETISKKRLEQYVTAWLESQSRVG